MGEKTEQNAYVSAKCRGCDKSIRWTFVGQYIARFLSCPDCHSPPKVIIEMNERTGDTKQIADDR